MVVNLHHFANQVLIRDQYSIRKSIRVALRFYEADMHLDDPVAYPFARVQVLEDYNVTYGKV